MDSREIIPQQLEARTVDRRAFATLLPALVAALALAPESHAQQPSSSIPSPDHPVTGELTPGFGASAMGSLSELVSGVYTPSEYSVAGTGRKSRSYLIGMLAAGNIRLEMHESHQEVGAVHEATRKHLHSEIWYVREGTCQLMTNGVVRHMGPGDVGLCCAGDFHYVANTGNTPCTYLVIAVGPPEV